LPKEYNRCIMVRASRHRESALPHKQEKIPDPGKIIRRARSKKQHAISRIINNQFRFDDA